jgi:GNAT superfamily N-acetyltransferase
MAKEFLPLQTPRAAAEVVIRPALMADASGESECTLDIVAGDPAYQGRDIGQHLIRYAEDQARHAGCGSIHLCTHVLMSENQALYSKLGYEMYDRRTEDGYDRVFMRKSISGQQV